MKHFYFHDDVYPSAECSTIREAARMILTDSSGKLVFLKVEGEDLFGKRGHIETIGGGMEKGETPRQTLQRECLEELGYECEILDELCVIEDDYHLLHRHNIFYFYAGILKRKVAEPQLNDIERSLRMHPCFLDIEKAYGILDHPHPQRVEKLVYRRDRMALKCWEIWRKHQK